MDNSGDVPVLSPADMLRKQNIGVKGKPRRQRDDQRHDLGVGANCGQRIRAVKIAHNRGVSGIEQLLDHAAEHKWAA